MGYAKSWWVVLRPVLPLNCCFLRAFSKGEDLYEKVFNEKSAEVQFCLKVLCA